jgi:hypothetical protein
VEGRMTKEAERIYEADFGSESLLQIKKEENKGIDIDSILDSKMQEDKKKI